MTQISDGLRLGPCYYAPATVKNPVSGSVEDLGTPLSHVYCQQLGAVPAAVSNGLVVAATATGAKTLSATGSLISGGTASFSPPRNLTVTSTSNIGKPVWLVGTDKYGQTMTAKAQPNNSTISTVKAFASFTRAYVTGSITGNVSIGTGNLIGFDYAVYGKGQVVAYSMDGTPQNANIVVAFTSTGTSTATTADVRGTITATAASAAPNGTRQFTITMLPITTNKLTAYGAAQA